MPGAALGAVAGPVPATASVPAAPVFSICVPVPWNDAFSSSTAVSFSFAPATSACSAFNMVSISGTCAGPGLRGLSSIARADCRLAAMNESLGPGESRRRERCMSKLSANGEDSGREFEMVATWGRGRGGSGFSDHFPGSDPFRRRPTSLPSFFGASCDDDEMIAKESILSCPLVVGSVVCGTAVLTFRMDFFGDSMPAEGVLLPSLLLTLLSVEVLDNCPCCGNYIDRSMLNSRRHGR